jgi:hypothetical protein
MQHCSGFAKILHMTDQELKDLVASIAVAQQRNEAQFARTDERFARTEAQMAETDAKIERIFARADERLARLDEQMAKTDAQLAKNDAKLDRLSAKYGGVSDNMGASAEDFFIDSLLESRQIGEIHFDQVLERVVGGRPGAQQEYDIVLLNGDSAAIVEVKYKVHPKALQQLDQQVALFKTHFPEFAHMKLYAGVAGFSVPAEVAQGAHEKGYFVLKRLGEACTLDAQAMRAH